MANDDRKPGPRSIAQNIVDAVFGQRKRLNPHERIVKDLNKREEQLEQHRNAYFAVIGALSVLNIFLHFQAGVDVPFVFFPALFWGMAVVMHHLNHRSWKKRYARELEQARTVLGIAAPLAPLAEHAPVAPRVVDGVEITEDRWVALLDKADQSLARAKRSLKTLPDAQSRSAVHDQLSASFSDVHELAAGAGRIAQALKEISPQGRAQLAAELEALDDRMLKTHDEGLKSVFHSNRALLKARIAKFEALEGELERMFVSAEGFVLAADNVHLDAASLQAGRGQRIQAALKTPASRLHEEVEMMKRVQRELAHY